MIKNILDILKLLVLLYVVYQIHTFGSAVTDALSYTSGKTEDVKEFLMDRFNKE